MKSLKNAVLAVVIPGVFVSIADAAPPKDLDKKLVLANPEKHLVGLKFGETKRTIQPGKASVLSPKKYPLAFEFWSGKNEVGWTKTQVDSAGVYVFRWEGDRWSMTKREAKKPEATAPKSSSTSSARRSTGSYQRTVRRPTVVQRPRVVQPVYRPRWRGSRYPYWCRGVWGLARLYQFIRDEEDRDILREIIIRGEIDDAIRDEIDDWLDDRLEAVPYAERLELQRAIDDIARLDQEDWQGITTLPADEWDRMREDIGSDISDADWNGLGDWADTLDQPIGDNLDLDDVGVDTMDENIDLGDLDDGSDNLDLDMGQDVGDLDMSDIAGGADNLDLSDFGGGGYQGGIDLSDLDLGPSNDVTLGTGDAGNIGIGDLGVGDAGAGDLGGGNWGGGGFDMNPGDYDAGSFDNIGGGWGGDYGGGDWGGGDFGGSWGGGDFGGFGGGDFGGDFGGGDFGGGDFGGDFGGGGDFF